MPPRLKTWIPLISFCFTIFVFLTGAFAAYNTLTIKDQVNTSIKNFQGEVKATYSTKEESSFIREQMGLLRSDVLNMRSDVSDIRSDVRKILINDKNLSKK